MSQLYTAGDTIDKDYIIESFLGEGGMGQVYRAKHRFIGQVYALKVIKASLINEETWLRFQREARILAALNHPNIVQVFNMGLDKNGNPYYVMELLNGSSLDKVITGSGPIVWQDSLKITIAVADALAKAHRKGIVHRDIKPANIVIAEDAVVKLVDFGLAKSIEAERLLDSRNEKLVKQQMTEKGTVFGSPYYMSPEQCRGEVSQSCDIYALGCTLFQCLTGRVPFAGETAVQTFQMHLGAPIPKLSDKCKRSFPEELDYCIGRSLAKNTRERYPSIDSFKHDLERILDGKPVGRGYEYDCEAESCLQEEDYDYDDELVEYEQVSAGKKKGVLLWSFVILALSLTVGLEALTLLAPTKKDYLNDFTAKSASIAAINDGYNYDRSLTEKQKVDSSQRDPVQTTALGGSKIRISLAPGFRQVEFGDSKGKHAMPDSSGIVELDRPISARFDACKTDPNFLKYFRDGDIDSIKVFNIKDKSQLAFICQKFGANSKFIALTLSGLKTSSSALREVKGLEHLQGLALEDMNVNVEDVAAVPNLKTASNICIKGLMDEKSTEANPIPINADQIVEVLKDNTSLSRLDLDDCAVSSTALQKLAGNKSIRRLSVGLHTWNIEDAKGFAKQSAVTELRISGFKLDDQVVRTLASSKTITTIKLINPESPDRIDDEFAGLKNAAGASLRVTGRGSWHHS